MRLTLPLLALFLSGCAASGPAPGSQLTQGDLLRVQAQQREAFFEMQQERQSASVSRADSLLALPPEALSLDDLRFLQAHTVERLAAVERQAAAADERSRGNVTSLTVLGAAGVALAAWSFLFGN